MTNPNFDGCNSCFKTGSTAGGKGRRRLSPRTTLHRSVSRPRPSACKILVATLPRDPTTESRILLQPSSQPALQPGWVELVELALSIVLARATDPPLTMRAGSCMQPLQHLAWLDHESPHHHLIITSSPPVRAPKPPALC
jgi:hypothetical protein